MIKNRMKNVLLIAFVVMLVMGADLKEKGGMQLLSSTSITIGTNSNATKIDLYTIPSKFNGIIEYVILREPSATLAGANDLNFGIGAGTTGTWIDGETGVVDMTATDDYMVLERTSHISNEFSATCN